MKLRIVTGKERGWYQDRWAWKPYASVGWDIENGGYRYFCWGPVMFKLYL